MNANIMFKLLDNGTVQVYLPLVILLHIISLYVTMPLQFLVAVSTFVYTYYSVCIVKIVQHYGQAYIWSNIVAAFATLGSAFRQGIQSSLQAPAFSWARVIAGWEQHRVGIGCCVKTLASSKDVMSVVNEGVKIGSMLGLESSLIDSLATNLSGKVVDSMSDPAVNFGVLQQNADVTNKAEIVENLKHHMDIDNVLPLIATAVTMSGKEISGVDFSTFINKQAKTMTSINTIWNEVKKAGVSLGFIKPGGYDQAISIIEEVNALRDEITWATTTLVTDADSMVRTEGYNRLCKLKDNVRDLEKRLKLISTPELKNFPAMQQITLLINKVEDVYRQIVIIKANYNIRQVPVGVCIAGESQVGKSHLAAWLIELVKKKLSEVPGYEYACEWTKWSRNDRDEFDTGYQGQKITYNDDAFQSRENNDHLFWITAISPEPLGTVQADLTQKGMPYMSQLVVVTANQLPEKTIKVNEPKALWERFPCTIRAIRNGNPLPDKKDGVYDTSFSWLKFQYASMTEIISGTRTTQHKNRAGFIRTNHQITQDFPEKTLDEIVDDIVQRIVAEDKRYNHKLAQLQTLRQQGDNEDGFIGQGVALAEDYSSEAIGLYDDEIDISRIDVDSLRVDENQDPIFKPEQPVDDTSEIDERFLKWMQDSNIAPTPQSGTFKRRLKNISEATLDRAKVITRSFITKVDSLSDRSSIMRFLKSKLMLPCMKQLKHEFPNLSNTDATIAISNAIVSEWKYKGMLDAKRAYNSVESTWMDVTPWVFHLTHRETKQKFYTYWRTVPDKSLANFLSLVGTFKVTEGEEELFFKYWCKQKTLKVYLKELGYDVLYGPNIANGQVLLSTGMVDWRKVVDIGDVLEQADESYRYWEMVLSHFVTPGALALLSLPWWISAAIPYHYFFIIARYCSYDEAGNYYGIFRSWSAQINTLISITYQSWYLASYTAFQEIYGYLSDLCNRLARYSVGKLISILEAIGVNVDQLWIDLMSIGAKVVLQAGLFILFLSLLYFVVKLIMSLLFPPKTQPLVQHNSNNESRRGKRKTTKTKTTRKLRHHCADLDFCDYNNCDEDFELTLNDWCAVDNQSDIPNTSNFNRLFVKNHKEALTPEIIAELIAEAPNELMYEPVNAADDCQIDEYKISAYRTKKSQLIGVMYEVDENIDRIPLVNGQYNEKCTQMDTGFYIDRDRKRVPIIKFRGQYVITNDQLYDSELLEKSKFYRDITCLLNYNVLDFDMQMRCKYIDSEHEGLDDQDGGGFTFVYIEIDCLSTIIKGNRSIYVKNSLKTVRSDFENLIGKKSKAPDPKSVVMRTESLDQQCDNDCLTTLTKIKKNNLVFVSVVEPDELDSDRKGKSCHGIGTKQFIVVVNHVVEGKTYVRWWRKEEVTKNYQEYSMASVVYRDPVRDLAVLKILDPQYARTLGIGPLSYMSNCKQSFSDLSRFLLSEKDWVNAAFESHILIYLPKSNIYTSGIVTYTESSKYLLNDNTKETYKYAQIELLNHDTHLTRPGDCGGPIVISKGKYKNRLIGFHAGGTPTIYTGVILQLEDISVIDTLEHHMDVGIDTWSTLIVDGEPTDLPKGEQVEFIGKFSTKTLPAANMSLDHWHKSPFAHNFEEALAPGPLDPYDKRIEVDLPTNLDGNKTLLLTPNSAMCTTIPEMDKDILDICVNNIIEEQCVVLKPLLEATPDNEDEMLDIALNGREHWEYCTGIEVNKASGLPWSVCGKPLKSDFIDVEYQTGKRTFNTTQGEILKRRILEKLYVGNRGNRLYSFGNSKLKDTVITLNKVAKGSTRVFTCIPVDEVLYDASLFSAYKEAYSKAGLLLHHGIGTNVHSPHWKNIFDKLNVHGNCFDLDYKNYDKILHREMMMAVFKIMRTVIQRLKPDKWDKARECSMYQNIETYMVDYDTVYKTKRGNKSGCYLTTIINCIANDLYSYYSWILLTKDSSIVEFRQHVSEVSFGDDKISSVSDDYKEIYNYCTVKQIMEDIGHTITPGNKEGEEYKYGPIDKLVFLKRNFLDMNGYIVAPLLKRSIESPFVWTDLQDIDVTIWKNLITESLLEACLHGKDYYYKFRDSLKNCKNSYLEKNIGLLLIDTWENQWYRYLNRYYGK